MSGIVLTLENEAFKTFLFYVSLLTLKMMAMSILTARMRFKNKSFANEEDTVKLKIAPKAHPDVERVRRAHLNDIENIPLFFFIGFFYLLTNPSAVIATWLFRLFTAARFAHTYVYAIHVVPQPARALSWGVGYVITGYMAVQTALYFF